jgi:hypothetical protein
MESERLTEFTVIPAGDVGVVIWFPDSAILPFPGDIRRAVSRLKLYTWLPPRVKK